MIDDSLTAMSCAVHPTTHQPSLSAPLSKSGGLSLQWRLLRPNRSLSPPRLSLSDDQQSAGQDAQARRPDDRRLFARRRANLLAVSGAEAGLRPGRPAVVVHGHRNVVRHARPFGPHRGAAGVRGPPADDENDAAGDLHAGRNDRADAENPAAIHAARPRPAAVRIEARSRRATKSSCRAS